VVSFQFSVRKDKTHQYLDSISVLTTAKWNGFQRRFSVKEEKSKVIVVPCGGPDGSGDGAPSARLGDDGNVEL
jgi:hypothetical protein